MVNMVKVDKNLCIGCGTCVSVCPEVFELDKDGKSKLKEKADLQKNEACIKDSIDQCPVDAISK